MVVTHISVSEFAIFLHRQIAAHVACPFILETPETGGGPGIDLSIPGLSRPAHAKEWRGECIVDRTLEPRTLALERDLSPRSLAVPSDVAAGKGEHLIWLVRRYDDLGPDDAHLRH